MEERGVGGDSNPVEGSEMPAAGASAAASDGKTSQERTSGSTYYDRPKASNKGDSSPGEELVKILSEKAARWRIVPAKYTGEQIARGNPGYGDDRAWTEYKRH